jgi:hypothetical protein
MQRRLTLKKLVMLLALLLQFWAEAANSSNIEFEKNWKSISSRDGFLFFAL